MKKRVLGLLLILALINVTIPINAINVHAPPQTTSSTVEKTKQDFMAITSHTQTKDSIVKTIRSIFHDLAQSLTTVSEASSGTCGTCSWTLSEDGELVVKPANGSEGTLQSFTSTSIIPWYSKRTEIKSVRFEGKVKSGLHLANMFEGCINLSSVDLTNLDTAGVSNFNSMFKNCKSLENLDVSKLNTTSAFDMRYMFDGCTRLISLDLSSFNTVNATNMYRMFAGCKSLTSLNLSGLKTGKAVNLSNIFLNCEKLKTLDVSGMDVSKAVNLSGMFGGCKSLTSLDLTNFKTTRANEMSYLFDGCSSLATLKFTTIDTSNASNLSYMFRGCSSLKALDLTHFNTSKANNLSGMFYGCYGLTSLNLNSFSTVNVTKMETMFYGCSNLAVLSLVHFNTENVTTMKGMFNGCYGLTSLDLTSFSTGNVTTLADMFKNCNSMNRLALAKSFKSINGSSLPTPSPIGSERGQYTGKWTKGTPYNHNDSLTPEQLANNYVGETMADTWYWEKNGSGSENQTYTSIGDRVYRPEDFTIEDGMSKEQIDQITKARNELLAQFQVEDKDGNAGYWTHIDDNTDVYTFYVQDPNIKWYVWEDEVEDGYETDYDITNPGTIEENATDKTTTITNAIPEENQKSFGSLEITKKVVNWKGKEVNEEREFVFKITLTDADGKQLEGSTTYGDLAFTDSKATTTLKSGETVVVEGIPSGYHYKVEEETPNGYTLAMTNQEGEVKEGTKTTVLAVNKKDKSEKKKSVDLTLAKRVTGNGEGGEFVFHVSLTGLAKSTQYEVSNSTESSFTSDDYGNADVEVKLKADEKAVIKGIPVGTKYTVTEEGGDYFASYIVEDSNNLGKVNCSNGVSPEKNNALSTSQETSDDGESVTITFTNRIQDTQNLRLVKRVVRSNGSAINDNEQYEMQLHFENLEPNSKIDSSLGPLQADEDGVIDITTYIKGGDEVSFSQVPVGTRYSFTESANDKTASYTIEDSNKLGKINQAKGENTTPQKDLATSSETVNKGEETIVTFYNTKATQGSIKLIKKDGSQKLEGVTFALAQENGTTVATKTTDANGEVLFEDLDEGVYTVKETKTVKGHSLLSEPFKVTIPFTIKKDKATEKKVDVSKATLVGDTYYFYDLTYTIDNGKNLNLPKTGQDTQSYLLVTLAMAAIVGTQCWIVTSKNRKGSLGSRRGKHNKA